MKFYRSKIFKILWDKNIQADLCSAGSQESHWTLAGMREEAVDGQAELTGSVAPSWGVRGAGNTSLPLLLWGMCKGGKKCPIYPKQGFVKSGMDLGVQRPFQGVHKVQTNTVLSFFSFTLLSHEHTGVSCGDFMTWNREQKQKRESSCTWTRCTKVKQTQPSYWILKYNH